VAWNFQMERRLGSIRESRWDGWIDGWRRKNLKGYHSSTCLNRNASPPIVHQPQGGGPDSRLPIPERMILVTHPTRRFTQGGELNGCL